MSNWWIEEYKKFHRDINDYEIFISPETESYSVKSPSETIELINNRIIKYDKIGQWTEK